MNFLKLVVHILITTILLFVWDKECINSRKVEKIEFQSPITIKEDAKTNELDKFLMEKKNIINFFSKTFQIEHYNLLNDIYDKNSNIAFNKNNIGHLIDNNGKEKDYTSFEEGLIEYLIDYSKKNRIKYKYIPYNGNKRYIIDLIIYFCTIYKDVDYVTALSIAASECGHFSVKYMLNYNNIYGGMYNKKLIKYNNIEYGVLSYIRLLSNNYYKKGLNTIEEIGRIYCPTYINGIKQASPHWINLVKTAQLKYRNEVNTVTIDTLIND